MAQIIAVPTNTTVQHACVIVRDARDLELSDFFEQPIPSAWRAHFREPTLEEVRGLGVRPLDFDF